MTSSELRQPSRITLIVFLLLLGVLLVVNYVMVAPYLIAVVMGAILSILFRRPYVWLCSKARSPKLFALLVTILIGLLVVLPIFWFGYMAVRQAAEVAGTMSGWSPESVAKKLMQWNFTRTLVGDVSAVEHEIREGLKKVASVAPGALIKIFGGLPEVVLQMVLGLISCYFFLVDGPRFIAWLRDKVPLEPEVRRTLFNSFRDTAFSSVAATLTAALVQTLIVMVGFLILGVPAVFLAGGLTFVFAWVPLVGSTPIWLGAALYLLSQGGMGSAIVMVGFGCLTGLSDNIVHPWVLKGRAEMHPLLGLVAIFGGISLFGIFGVFLGPILAALLVSVLQIWPAMAERFQLLPSGSSASPIISSNS